MNLLSTLLLTINGLVPVNAAILTLAGCLLALTGFLIAVPITVRMTESVDACSELERTGIHGHLKTRESP